MKINHASIQPSAWPSPEMKPQVGMRQNDLATGPTPSPPSLTSHKTLLKPLKRIPNKRQAHLGRHPRILTPASASTNPIPSPIPITSLTALRITLRQLIDGETRRIDVRRKLRLKGRTDAPQRGEIDAGEEGVGLDLGRAEAPEAGFGVGDQTWLVIF